MRKIDYKLKLQNTIRLFHINGITILNRSGISIRIDDADGIILWILENIDNTTINDLHTNLPEKYLSYMTISKIHDIINQLDEYCVFEKANPAIPESLDEYSLKRWNRNIDFFGSFCKLDQNKFDVQAKIKQAKVVLLGVGGVGTHILYDLISIGITNITAIDFDTIELSNLNRQILYDESDVGKKKVAAAKTNISRYINNHNIKFIDEYLTSSEQVYNLVKNSDVVIGCVDRPSNVVSWINEGCVKAKVPFITGGVDTSKTCTYTVIPGKSGCVKCWELNNQKNDSLAKDLREAELARDVLTLPPRPAIVNLVSIQAGYILTEAIKIITEIMPPVATNKLIAFDFATMETKVSESWQKLDNCPVCGEIN